MNSGKKNQKIRREGERCVYVFVYLTLSVGGIILGSHLEGERGFKYMGFYPLISLICKTKSKKDIGLLHVLYVLYVLYL